jgi:radical SAM superfamily enzyme YgiQ (UPF0313 family)
LKRKVLLDQLDFGLQESEHRHLAYGEFALDLPDPSSDYGGPSYVVSARDLTHFRQSPRASAFRLQVPDRFLGVELSLEVALRTYQCGEGLPQLESTLVQVMTASGWRELGAVTIPADSRFRVYQFEIPSECVDSSELLIWIDDTRNFHGIATHYGKAVGYLRLSGAPELAGTGPAPKPEQTKKAPPDIVLVMCPVWDVLMPPVALGTLASVLEGNGIEVAVYDFNIECYSTSDENGRHMWDGENAMRWTEKGYAKETVEEFAPLIGQAVEAILAHNAPYVGFSIATTNAAFSAQVAAGIKQASPETKIVFGGPGLPFFQEGELGSNWDYMIYGAGEKPLISILKDDNPDVLGVIRPESWEPYDPGKNRSFLNDMDSLPLTHYSHFDLLRYLHPWRLPVLTSRGCINACKYCFDTIFYKPFTCLSGQRAFEQLRFLHERHGRRVFEFADLLCNGDLEQLRIMCDLLIEADLGVEWGSFAVMRPGMTPELMNVMKAAGCKYLHYGFETGSQKMLELMGRDYSVDDARDTLVNTRKAGIHTKVNIMVGFPGEDDATVAETVAFIAKYGKYIDLVDAVNPVFLMVSTDLLKNKEKYDIEIHEGEPNDWETEGSDLDLRQRWAGEIVEALRKIGVRCQFAMLPGFTCKNVTDDF